MAVTNTGIVERVITGVHDANFVRPLGDEEVSNGGFDTDTDWTKGTGWSISGGVASCDGTQISNSNLYQVVYTSGKTFKTTISVTSINGTLNVFTGSGAQTMVITSVGDYQVFYESTTMTMYIQATASTDVTIDNISVKEALVTRESTATNTGVVERSITGVHDANFVRPLGDEEVSNGDFSNGSTDWSLSNWSITNNVLLADVGGYIYQSDVFEIGKSYKVSINVKDYTIGGLRIDSNGQNNWTPNGANTTATIYISNLDRTYLLLEGGFRGSIDNVSVKEMLVTRESTATNTGIVERGVTGVNESIAFRQDTRTNLIAYSEEFSNAYWTKSGASVISGFSSPSADAPLGAFKLVANASNANIISRPQLISNTANTNSIYLKRVLGTGIVSIFNAAGNETVVTLTNEWQRFSTSISVNPSNAYHGVRVYDLGDEVMVFGAQTEQLSYSTSYIPTSGAAVTVDNNSTSVVNNTGIVERPIVGVNESDEMFPDNGTSSVVNISEVIIPLLDSLEARATTFENREATQEILINLQKC